MSLLEREQRNNGLLINVQKKQNEKVEQLKVDDEVLFRQRHGSGWFVAKAGRPYGGVSPLLFDAMQMAVPWWLMISSGSGVFSRRDLKNDEMMIARREREDVEVHLLCNMGVPMLCMVHAQCRVHGYFKSTIYNF